MEGSREFLDLQSVRISQNLVITKPSCMSQCENATCLEFTLQPSGNISVYSAWAVCSNPGESDHEH